jgi:hypothetical protein
MNEGTEHELDAFDALLARARVEERPFPSPAPLIGPLLDWLRGLWISVAARWYIRPMLEQQNEFNRLIVTHLRAQADHLYAQDAPLIAQDRALVAQTRATAELTAQLVQLNRRLVALEARLVALETQAPKP